MNAIRSIARHILLTLPLLGNGILAAPGAIAVHLCLSGLDLSGLVLAPCLLGCAGTGWQRASLSGTLLPMAVAYLRRHAREGAGSSEEATNTGADS